MFDTFRFTKDHVLHSREFIIIWKESQFLIYCIYIYIWCLTSIVSILSYLNESSMNHRFFVFMVARTYKDFIRDHLGGGCKHFFFALPLLEEMIHFDQYLSHRVKPQTGNYPPYNKQLAHANQRVGRWILFWDGYFQGICWFQGGYHVDSRRRPTANHSAKSWVPRANAPCFVLKCLDWRWDETNNIPTTTNAIYKQKIT